MKKQLRYCIRGANESGIHEHPQIQMNNLGYKVLDAIPQPIGDCWWFTVEEFIEPLEPYLRKIEY